MHNQHIRKTIRIIPILLLQILYVQLFFFSGLDSSNFCFSFWDLRHPVFSSCHLKLIWRMLDQLSRVFETFCLIILVCIFTIFCVIDQFAIILLQTTASKIVSWSFCNYLGLNHFWYNFKLKSLSIYGVCCSIYYI